MELRVRRKLLLLLRLQLVLHVCVMRRLLRRHELLLRVRVSLRVLNLRLILRMLGHVQRHARLHVLLLLRLQRRRMLRLRLQVGALLLQLLQIRGRIGCRDGVLHRRRRGGVLTSVERCAGVRCAVQH